MLRGSWASRSRSTRLEPMKPAEPVMRRVLVFCDILVFDGQELFGDELGDGVMRFFNEISTKLE